MNREIHVRFWEGLGVRFPRATHSGYRLPQSALNAKQRAVGRLLAPETLERRLQFLESFLDMTRRAFRPRASLDKPTESRSQVQPEFGPFSIASHQSSSVSGTCVQALSSVGGTAGRTCARLNAACGRSFDNRSRQTGTGSAVLQQPSGGESLLGCVACQVRVNVMPNVRAKRATTAGRQARAGENVPRTARPGLVACRWRSA